MTYARSYPISDTFWVGVREEAGLRGVRIHGACHTYASRGVMNGVGLTAVGKLLGHRKRATTAIYANLDDAALRGAAARAAAVIARTIGYQAVPPPDLPHSDEQAAPQDRRTPRQCGTAGEGWVETPTNRDPADRRPSCLFCGGDTTDRPPVAAECSDGTRICVVGRGIGVGATRAPPPGPRKASAIRTLLHAIQP